MSLDYKDYDNEKDKCLVALRQRKATQESKVRRLKAKADMYELLKAKAQSAINLVGIFHPVFRSKTKVMITSSDVQGSYYKKQSAIAESELENVTNQINEITEGADFSDVIRKKHAVQGSKVMVKAGVINFQNPKNAKLLEGLFDILNRPTDNYKRLVQLCVDYPRSVATLPKDTLKEIKEQTEYVGVILEIYKLFGKKKKQEEKVIKKPVDTRLEKMANLEKTKPTEPVVVESTPKQEEDLDNFIPFKKRKPIDDITADLDPLDGLDE